jgi:glycosyltransferase involved in cell wall biosynthesis
VSVQTSKPELEVLLPVHNEADSIEATVREIYEVLSLQVSLRFIICEDGSVDDTKDILRELSKSLPMNLILSEEPAFCRHDTGL